MLNWSDDEITSIIWDEGCRVADHVVPFTDKWIASLSNRGWNYDAVITPEEPAQKASSGVDDYPHVSKHPDFIFDSWAALSAIGKDDSSTCNITNYASSNAYLAIVAKGRETFPSNLQSRSQTGSSWSSTGNLDDLERFLNNEEPVFDQVKAHKHEELWSRSTDAQNGPIKPPSGVSVRCEHLGGDDPDGVLLRASLDDPEKLLQHKKERENAESQLHCTSSHPMEYRPPENQLVPCSLQACLPSPSGQEHLEEAATVTNYSHGRPAFVPPSSESGSRVRFQERVTSETRPANRQCMTPQEKADTLKRKQQKQAALAIARQQEQFGDLLDLDDRVKYGRNECLAEGSGAGMNEDPGQNFQKRKDFLIADAEYSSREESSFFQLREVIGQMDRSVRLCLRDSLFRLSESAMRRHSPAAHGRETGEEIKSRTSPGAESATNPIDRAVAHLLFFRDSAVQEQGPLTRLSASASSTSCDRAMPEDLSRETKIQRLLGRCQQCAGALVNDSRAET